MGSYDEEYRAALEAAEPSRLLALGPEGEPEPDPDEIVERLRAVGFRAAASAIDGDPDTRWCVELEPLEPDSGTAACLVWLQAAPELSEFQLGARGLNGDDVDAIRASTWAIGTERAFRGHPLDEYHHQLLLAAAAVPGAVALYDESAYRLHSGDWLREAARSSVPPGPSCLYSIHSVYDDSTAEAEAWLHTHGMLRCRSVELELVGVPLSAVNLMADLLNTAAALFIDAGPVPAGEAFEVGSDLQLAWLPWQRVVAERELLLGGAADRDEIHGVPSGVLVAPGDDGGWRDPTCYTELLEGDPLLYVTDGETERMALLAKERVHEFLRLQRQLAGAEGWQFLVKLGYLIDGAEGEHDREHLWFRVHGFRADVLDATLLNSPYRIERLHEGQRGEHSLDLLTDWLITGPYGSFGPSSLLELERSLLDRDANQSLH